MTEPRINPYRMAYMDTAAKYLVEDFLPRYMRWFWDQHYKSFAPSYTPEDMNRLADEWDREHGQAGDAPPGA